MTLRFRRALALLAPFAVLAVACDDGAPPEDRDAGVATGADGSVLSDGAVAPDGTDAGPPEGTCPAPTLACTIEEPLVGLPVEVVGRNDRGAVDGYGGSSCGVGRNGGEGGTGAMDLAYAFTAPEAGRYEISTDGSAFDTLLSVRDGCDGPELACNDDVARGDPQSALEVELDACQTIVIVVDGYNADARGAFRLSVTARESACGDGGDNDGDGLTDCDDPDCFSLECNGGDDWPMEWQAFEWEVLELTNQARARGHDCDTEGQFGPAPPLEMDEVIRVAARGHALDMGENDYFDHRSQDGRTFSDRMREAGFEGDFPWGENIATGQTSARQVVDGWLESDGHCANLMNPAYRTIGVGYAFEASSRFGHQWVQKFAASH